MKFGIFPRLTAGYLIVLFLLGASNIYAILKLVDFNTIILAGYNEDIRTLDLGKRLADAIFSQRRYEQKYLLTKDPVLYRQFLAAKEDFEKSLTELAAVPASPAGKESVDTLEKSHRRYQTLIDAEVSYINEKRDYDRNRYKMEKERFVDAILEALDKLENHSRGEFHRKAEIVSAAGASARRVALFSFLTTVILVVLFAFLITRSIANPLMKLIRKTREIEAGIFACDLAVSAPPEIMELTEAFNRMCGQLKDTEKLKADFFAMISHELKTPLTTIKEGTSLLLEGVCGPLTEKQNRLLTIITAESNRLATLVHSILNLSKMEAGMMKYSFTKESIEPLIARAVNEIIPYAEAKRLHLETRIAGDLPSCRMDAERIIEVLRNLIGNAVKFTPDEGRITIAANAVEGGIEVSISDTGPGIPLDKLETIFEKYESADQKKGTGLGLAIVKHIVAAHGGKVWAKSDPGGETSFSFVLPY
jgi:two-component system, NtrC family, sensor histidine kinase GlrK